MKRMIGFMVSVMLTFAVNAADSQVNTHKHQTDKGKVTPGMSIQRNTEQSTAITADAASSNTTEKVTSQQMKEHKKSVKEANYNAQKKEEEAKTATDTQKQEADSPS
ncbi:TPA: hypothetical protein JBG74_07210 [Legionella pneumophila]|uniref:Acid shock protein n=2 Tax=Legionella pneumophila TaxID=446 RepID=Q5ZVZ9_LEGPH|nr:hypothetical protein [Legionella pneumophila]AAU27372.1 hypothetical protein lpg1289 [Legionella pneumophila subsp. pneumophila str. Philadelphia 1]AEW51492.1 hypothetical protein lp12_1226 [Legionella pneumophila subsp. pneumophila ATCC 43290]AGH54010.1 hypothetical protein LPE509_01919 [Legionella pneumophila subsp. pneumophila LPE509]AGN14182.1 hypothetical protein LP6_1271 [Legionella pneumophila subsp. pneumophila str. Thunder Bay]AOU04305.1 hypothetical protein A9E97_06195 [Legionella